MKFRKKPVVIEAAQFNGTNLLPGMDWDMGGAFVRTIHENQQCYVMAGDWIIPEPDGIHYYPCKPDIFEKTYEPIDGDLNELMPETKEVLKKMAQNHAPHPDDSEKDYWMKRCEAAENYIYFQTGTSGEFQESFEKWQQLKSSLPKDTPPEAEPILKSISKDA